MREIAGVSRRPLGSVQRRGEGCAARRPVERAAREDPPASSLCLGELRLRTPGSGNLLSMAVYGALGVLVIIILPAY